VLYAVVAHNGADQVMIKLEEPDQAPALAAAPVDTAPPLS